MIAALTALCLCAVTGPYAPAVRMDPPPPPPVQVLFNSDSAGGRCTGAMFLLEHYNPGWSVDRMAGIAFRESRCLPGASNSCCSGLFQIHRSWISQLSRNTECGIDSRTDLYDPAMNVCAAAYVYRVQGISAWSTS